VYGTAAPADSQAEWSRPPIRFLLGGTVAPETGAPLLVEAIRILRKTPEIASRMQFEITGKGSSVETFELLADGSDPVVIVHGRTTAAEYRRIVASSHVGLALKPNSGALADTTFPSKVLEIASNGCLLLSTDISDVRHLFGDAAVYLAQDDPEVLAGLCRWIVTHPEEASAMARRASSVVAERCSPASVGQHMRELFFPSGQA
jgi:glycosyltransferase involved in cell wall biosynthesis